MHHWGVSVRMSTERSTNVGSTVGSTLLGQHEAKAELLACLPACTFSFLSTRYLSCCHHPQLTSDPGFFDLLM